MKKTFCAKKDYASRAIYMLNVVAWKLLLSFIIVWCAVGSGIFSGWFTARISTFNLLLILFPIPFAIFLLAKIFMNYTKCISINFDDGIIFDYACRLYFKEIKSVLYYKSLGAIVFSRGFRSITIYSNNEMELGELLKAFLQDKRVSCSYREISF